jgi:hypothetical protein
MGRLALPAAQRPQRFLAKQGNIPYGSGQSNPLNISQTDYLTSLDLISNQTVVVGSAAPSGLNGAGAYAPLGNVQVKVNGGRAPFSLPGWHTNVYNQVWNHDYVDGLVATPLSLNTTNLWANHLRIPLTVDPATELGSWFTGDVTLNLQVLLTFDSVSQVFGTVNGATLGGSYDVYSEKFSAPAPDEPGGWLNEISYYKQTELYLSGGQLSNGTTTFTLETDEDYLRILLIFYTGARDNPNFAPADGLYLNISLIINDKFRILDTLSEAKMRFEMLETYTRVLPAGTCVIDFMRLIPPGRRDILPTDPDTTKRVQLQIASTSSSNYVDIVTETVVDSQFALKWVQSAQAKAGKQGS